LNAFNRLFFTATLDPSNSRMHCLSLSFSVNTFGTYVSLPSTPCSIQSLPLETWTKVAVSVKATLSSQFDLNLYLYTPTTAPFHHTLSQTANTDFYPMPFTPHLIYGAHTIDQRPPMFPGGFREVTFLSSYLSPAQLTQDYNRALRGGRTLAYLSTLIFYYPEGPTD
jgi:hypothetical protein